MSIPKIPDLDPKISISTKDALNVILLSIGYEEISLAQVIRAEAKKVQYVIEQAKDHKLSGCDIRNLTSISNSVSDILGQVIKKEMLLESKMKEAIKAIKHIHECTSDKYDANCRDECIDNENYCRNENGIDENNCNQYRRCPDIFCDEDDCRSSCDCSDSCNNYTKEELEIIKDIELGKHHRRNRNRNWL